MERFDGKNDDDYVLDARNQLLKMMGELIQENENSRFADDLIHAVTSRWILLFLNKNVCCETASIATRLFYIIWKRCYYSKNKFKEAFIILEKLLVCRFLDPKVYLPLWAILCNVDIDSQDWDIVYEEANLLALLCVT